MGRIERLILFAWTMVAAALVFSDVSGPIRIGVSLGWLAIVPGLAITRLIGLGQLGIRLMIGVPLSLALAAAVSAVIVYAGIPSWELGMSVLLSLTVAVMVLEVAPPRLGLRPMRIEGPARGKLADPARQARLLDTLQQGGTLADAADAAQISLSTLRRALRNSPPLRRAVEVAAGAELEQEIAQAMPPRLGSE